jgi:hypothetical protein
MAIDQHQHQHHHDYDKNEKVNKRQRQQQLQMSPGSPSFDTTPRGITAANHRRFMRGVVLGFALGLAASSMFAMIRESDAHLKHLSAINDMAAGAMPFLHSACDYSKPVQVHVVVGDNATNEKEDPPKDERKKEDDEDDHLAGLTVVNPNVKDFDPDQSVVLVTKIHGPKNLPILEQALCLLTQAYNNRVNYDIIVFSSDPVPESVATVTLRQVVAPANIFFITDNPGLHQMVNALSPERRAHLLQRCNVTDTSQLTWYTNCVEMAATQTMVERIAYTWQAEFRAKHLWVHPAMMKYKYMMWFDVDLFCSKVWPHDPISLMARYDVILLFDHFPQGMAKGSEVNDRIRDAFDGTVYCEINMYNGTLVPKEGKCLGKQGRLKQVHGFFHVTDLDFYRSPPVLKWHDVLIGDSKFSRQFDDQIGVTMPAAILAGNRSWDMRYHGIKLDVIHNYLFDGRHERRAGGFITWFNENGEKEFPEAYAKCKNINAGG